MVLYNERLQTEDFVEIKDVKIVVSNAYPSLGTAAGDSLHTVSNVVSSRALTLSERAALDAMLTTPSASNPIVLKDDIEVYYTQGDFGSILDAVPTYADLLLLTPNTGDVVPVTADGIFYLWDGAMWVELVHTGTSSHTLLINLNGDTSFMHVASTTLNTWNNNAHVHGDMYFDPTDVDTLNDIITVSNIYSDDTPIRFGSRGTLPDGLNSTTTYYIKNATPTSIQVAALPGGPPIPLISQGTNLTPTGIVGEPVLANSHFLDIFPYLEGIMSSGSGQIITDAERTRLNALLTPNIQPDALTGTAGTPSNVNRYVTDFDARVNTLRNPYATVGSGVCSYPGNTQAALDDAIRGISSFPCTITVGSPGDIVATTNFGNDVEVFFFTDGTLPEPLMVDTVYYIVNFTPTSFQVATTLSGTPIDITSAGSGNFIVGGNNSPLNQLALLPENFTVTNTLTWEKQADGWVIGGWVPQGTTFTCAAMATVLEVLGSALEPVIVRNIKFILSGGDGIVFSRPHCRVEHCTFQGTGDAAVALSASHCAVVDCFFTGTFGPAIDILADYAHITGNTFSLSAPSVDAVWVQGNYAQISSNAFKVGKLSTFGEYALLRGNTFDATASLDDTSGLYTRYLQSPSYASDAGGQPFVVRKTIGGLTSGADYRGDTHTVFQAAFSDPNVKDFEVLPGTYTFAATVTVPNGVRVHGNKAVKILSGTTVFNLSSNTLLDNLQFEYVGSNPPPYVLTSTGTSHVSIVGCNVHSGGIFLDTVSYALVSRCTFISYRGVRAESCSFLKVDGNYFSATDFLTYGAIYGNVCSGVLIKDNFVQTGLVSLQGTSYVVHGNTFVQGSPDKTATSTVGGIWQGNFPLDANIYGNLVEEISVNRHMRPSSPGCARVLTGAEVGGLSFTEVHSSSAGTGLVRIPFKVDTSYTYTVALSITSIASINASYWKVSVRFYDENTNTLGAASVGNIQVTRAGLTERVADIGTFTSAAYGVTTPTHYSIGVERLPLDPLDTLTYSADLIDTTMSLRRG